MSTYYQEFKDYEKYQQAGALALLLLGLALGLGWHVLPRVIPARWQPAARWVYLALAAGAVAFSVFSMGS